VLSPDGRAIALSAGLRLEASALPATSRADASTWIVPGLGTDNPAVIGPPLGTLAARARVSRG